jgi:AraC-like DNA-binding protein
VTSLLTPEIWLQPALHPVYARLLCAELRGRGFSEAEIVEGTRLNWQTLHTDNRFISFEQMRRLILHALALSGCPWLGLDVGTRTQVSAHGALGQAAAASSNLAQTIALIQRFIPLRQRMVTIQLLPGEGANFAVIENLMTEDVRELLLGMLVATMVRLLETVTGLDLKAEIRIEWPFPAPPWAAEYQRLALQNEFGHEQLRIHLSSTLLNSPSLAADAEALRVALRDCEHQLQHQMAGGSLTQRLQQRLVNCLDNYPTLEALAAEEHVSTRTLIRRLHEEGTTYQQLVDVVREELACWLLLQTKLPIDAIAERLGYGDTSNLSRTFRRWMGMTPSEFRDRH